MDPAGEPHGGLGIGTQHRRRDLDGRRPGRPRDDRQRSCIPRHEDRGESICPSRIDLAATQAELFTTMLGRESRTPFATRSTDGSRKRYDYALIGCPRTWLPSRSSGLVAADGVITSRSRRGYYAMKGPPATHVQRSSAHCDSPQAPATAQRIPRHHPHSSVSRTNLARGDVSKALEVGDHQNLSRQSCAHPYGEARRRAAPLVGRPITDVCRSFR